MSPNDFGIYAGTIYASYWTPEIGFDGSSKPIPPLIIYDLSGRKVAILVNERKVPGIHEIMWNAEGMEPGVDGTFRPLEGDAAATVGEMSRKHEQRLDQREREGWNDD